MNLLIAILYFLSLSRAIQAAPVAPAEGWREDSQRFSWETIPWRKYLPTVAAVGLVGILAGLVFLGTRAEQRYQEVELQAAEAEYNELSEEEKVNFRFGFLPHHQALGLPEEMEVSKESRKEFERAREEYQKAKEERNKARDKTIKVDKEFENRVVSASVSLVRNKEIIQEAKAQQAGDYQDDN